MLHISEEADTRMLLHAMHADKEFGRKNTKGRIIVKSPDTDVFVLCVHFSDGLDWVMVFNVTFNFITVISLHIGPP
jgi:hypothetical protein